MKKYSLYFLVLISVSCVSTREFDKFITEEFVPLKSETNSLIDMPVGTIIPWSGGDLTILGDHWKVCDGTPLDNSDYKELSQVLGTNWGNDNPPQGKILLPNLQGVFLRGVNGVRKEPFNDPDADARLKADGSKFPSGQTGNVVGSFQRDTVVSHDHDINDNTVKTPDNRVGGFAGNGGATASINQGEKSNPETSTSFGGSETRPTNAYVYFIIKVK